MNIKYWYYLTIIVFCIQFFFIGKAFASKKQKVNILFIIVDDLRPELGCYGNTKVQSPNIDKLANAGIVFTNSYCNFPVCGPSRASILSGLRPHKTRFTNNACTSEKDAPNSKPIQNFFKEKGYVTISLGKVYHKQSHLEGWSEEPWHPLHDEESSNHPDKWRNYLTNENLALCAQNNGIGNSFESADVGDFDYFDGKIALKSIEYLKMLKKTGQPFFMAVGFVKPHLPFNAPKKYFDRYPLKSIRLPDNYYRPANVSDQAMYNWMELQQYIDIPDNENPLSEVRAKELIRAYWACVSYVDAMVGEVLNALEKLGMSENTIVCLIGDHGWLLGEHTKWGKICNFDKAMNAPLIIKAPGFSGGKKSEALVEFIDLYPTFCDLTGYKSPTSLEGKSIRKILKHPTKRGANVAYCKNRNGWTVITKGFAFTQWYNKNGEVEDQMLFDHKEDREENKNVAKEAKYKDELVKQSKLLKKYYSAKVDK